MKLITEKSKVLSERELRIVARGEHTNHSHVVVGGEVEIIENEKIFKSVSGNPAIIKHLKENEWMSGSQIWTGEHKDILIPEGKMFKIIHQQVYDPVEAQNRRAID